MSNLLPRFLALATIAYLGIGATLGPVSVLYYGADRTGATDSTAAFQSAIADSSYVTIPCGTYRVNLNIANRNYFTLEGSPCSQLIPNDPAQNLINITYNNGGGSSVFKGFTAFGSPGSASGIVLTLMGAGGGNVQFDRLHLENFPSFGLACIGTAASISSGNGVNESYVLYSGQENLHWEWCTDAHITNNNFGGPRNGTTPTYGVHLIHAGANWITGNFIYDNGIGLQLDNSSLYNEVTYNRITQSAKQGFVCLGCQWTLMTNNQIYQNSHSTVGGYESVQFVGGWGVLVKDNLIYDWTGVAHTTYSLTIDATSAYFSVIGNSYSQNTIAPSKVAGWHVTETNNQVVP